jgi:RNA polymerase-binding transcription factor DksA
VAKKPVKPVAKPAAKPVAKKAAPAKAVPAKKSAKPAAKPVAKKPVKPVAKPAAKATAKPVVKAPVKAVKPAPKAPAKPVGKAPVKPAPAKVVVKPAGKAIPVAKPTAKPAPAPVVKKAEREPIAPPKKASVVPVPKAAAAKNVRDIKVAPPKKVEIPKIATKTARTYQPDFTKSVLDQPKNEKASNIVRYGDVELMEFKDLILRKLESAKKELTYLQGLITRKDEMGGDESENRYMTMEDGSLSMEREQLSQMASRQITYIDHLEKALMRIENKTYGICRVTGKLIDKARLRAVPHATLSIEAKMSMNK